MDEHMQAFLAAIAADDDLNTRIKEAASAAEVIEIANGLGIALTDADFAVDVDADLSDADLEAVSGGTASFVIQPRTHWLYCDNPKTDWCTYKC